VRLFKTVVGLRCFLEQAKKATLATEPARIGFVPTMGALHDGHLSLIRQARRDNDVVVVSIFVNPLQFSPNEDFQQYPRTVERDRDLCEQAGVDVIFMPSTTELYGDSTLDPNQSPQPAALTQVIPPQPMLEVLCGPSRPTHFPGVATIVTKLLSIVQPNTAYFGQKDAQQVAILQRVVSDLNLAVELVVCPIVREPNGLAMSSRNQYLSAEERSQAATMFQSLQQADQLFRSGIHTTAALIAEVRHRLEAAPNLRVDYVDVVHPVTLAPLTHIEESGLLAIAVYLGKTRLIDNIVLRNRQPIVAIDGPAGAGKSTVVRQVAHKLGLLYLDTGAMYRAVTWQVLQLGIAVDDEAAIAELVSQSKIQLLSGGFQHDDMAVAPCQVWINDQNVTQAIRTLDVTAQVSAIAAQPAVRQHLVKLQQAYGQKGGVVMDGRDIGTSVFPDAELKIFLTASVQERARRRQLDLKQQHQPEVDLEELERAIFERDFKDSSRRVSPLRKAQDAVEIDTDHLSIEQVTQQIVDLYHQRITPLKA
jgi:pantoate ligase / CMP/dCMP kinase